MTRPVLKLTCLTKLLPMGQRQTEWYWADRDEGGFTYPIPATMHDWTQCDLLVSRRVLRDGGWQGDVTAWHVGQSVTIGPYALRIVEERNWGSYTFRADGPLVGVTIVKYRLKYGLEELVIRLFLTLYVWGLAEYPEYGPSWKLIKGLRRFNRDHE